MNRILTWKRNATKAAANIVQYATRESVVDSPMKA